jgi:hypothetical protein
MPMDISTFEAWVRESKYLLSQLDLTRSTVNGHYAHSKTELAWQAFLAGAQGVKDSVLQD